MHFCLLHRWTKRYHKSTQGTDPKAKILLPCSHFLVMQIRKHLVWLKQGLRWMKSMIRPGVLSTVEECLATEYVFILCATRSYGGLQLVYVPEWRIRLKEIDL